MTMKLDTVSAPRKDWKLVVVAGLDSKTVTVFFVVGAAIILLTSMLIKVASNQHKSPCVVWRCLQKMDLPSKMLHIF